MGDKSEEIKWVDSPAMILVYEHQERLFIAAFQNNAKEN